MDPDVASEAAPATPHDVVVSAPGAPRARRRRALALGVLAYTAVAAWMFMHVLSLGPSGATTCACSDSSLFAWFFEWPLIAITQGHNPFFSTAMFHPQGINMLSNTSVTAWTFLMLPVTAAFGPFASLNVALIAAPVASATAAMWVAQRWVRSDLAAAGAGLLYGFSPLVLFQSAGSHLMVTSLVVPPLVLACVDELFWRRRRSPVAVGAALGALVVIQFFSGTEVLVMMLVATVAALVVIGTCALVTARDAALDSIRHGIPGLAVAGVVAAVVLAWPAYYALDGPGHFVGLVWPGLAPAQASLRSYLVAVPGTTLWWAPHWGRLMRPTYLGPPLAATLVIGAIAWRRDRRLLCAVGLTALVAWLALGERYAFSPWHYLRHLPVLDDVMNERFSGLMFLPAGLAMALVVDRVARVRTQAVGAACGLVVGLACVVPFAANAAHGVPYAASTVWQPTWYADNASSTAKGQVILGFPFFNTTADLLGVQALHAMAYSVAGGTGPEWIDSRQGAEEPGYKVIQAVSSAVVRPVLATSATPLERAEVRAALRGWKVTLVVIPDQVAPDTVGVAHSPAAVATWFTSVLGPANFHDDAWVWHLHAG